VLKTDSLSVGANSRLDLNDNDMIVANGNYGTITNLIRTARNGGAWNQPGITSSTAAAANPKNKGLGTVTGAEYRSVQGVNALFSGFSVQTTDILVKYTYNGDTDLSGLVDFDDYSRTDAGFNNNRTGWFNGDFDYSGVVDFDDYSLIDQAFNTQSGTLRRAMTYLEGGDRSPNGMDAPALQLVMEHFDTFGVPYAQSFLSSVPEPTGALAISGLAALAASRRRRRA
jgi:MYXO-CTERM domain-containing protein